jgi:hypothetical protein
MGVQDVKSYSIAGPYLTYSLLKELALHIRTARVTHASQGQPKPFQPCRINDKWIQRFKGGHPQIQSIYARQLEASRKEGATFEKICMAEVRDHHNIVLCDWNGNRLFSWRATVESETNFKNQPAMLDAIVAICSVDA